MADDVDNESAEVARLARRSATTSAVSSRRRSTAAATGAGGAGSSPWSWCSHLRAFDAATVGVWARRNFLDTEQFVSRVGPSSTTRPCRRAHHVDDDQLMKVIDSRQLFEQVLPEKGKILAVPLESALRGFVHDRVAQFVATDEFHKLWTGASTVAHRRPSRCCAGRARWCGRRPRGHDQPDTGDQRRCWPDHVGLARDLRADRQPARRDGADVPEAARRGWRGAGHRPGSQLRPVQGVRRRRAQRVAGGVALADKFVPLLLPLSVVLAGLALWASDRRRRTLLQLSAGLVLAMVLLRRVGFRVPEEVATLPRTAQGAIAGIVVDSLRRSAAHLRRLGPVGRPSSPSSRW